MVRMRNIMTSERISLEKYPELNLKIPNNHVEIKVGGWQIVEHREGKTAYGSLLVTEEAKENCVEVDTIWVYDIS